MTNQVTAEALALLDDEIAQHEIGNRTAQAALLAWFLEAGWRLDLEDIPDYICDGPGDKGVDAIYVNDDESEITIFQSKRRADPLKSTQGENDLKAFVATSDYFSSSEALETLLSSKPNAELRKLILRTDLPAKITDGTYKIKLVFVVNSPLDASATGYIASRDGLAPELTVFDLDNLTGIAERTQRPSMRPEQVILTGTIPPIHHQLTTKESLAITLIPAKQLVHLPGISDQTLFSQNVRLALGRSAVNRGIKETIQAPSEHPLFPAFHNGLTILTTKLEVAHNDLILDGVAVVNGCQSLTSLHTNQSELTDDLQLLVKIVQVGKKVGDFGKNYEVQQYAKYSDASGSALER